MEILGIGWQELIFIVVIAIIVLGPKDMQKAGRTIGRWLNQLIQSDSWKVFQKTSSELRNLPTNLMREANMEMREAEKELRHALDPRLDPSASSSNPSTQPRISRNPSIDLRPGLPPSKEMEKRVQPPTDTANAPEAGNAAGSEPDQHD
ncbi:MAG: twin-arginine translocase TatA/TatE family subunit [Anaerolineales bacterium]